ncbi:hypothetical protein BD779DRAFT_514645 [Infundibulicybe gibba]|nr:hypothetical protein BD779DRAFT_514645 [Infundibulicybe gibba]
MAITHAPPGDLAIADHIIPSPPAPEQITSATEEAGDMLVDPLTCENCGKDITKGALSRHRIYSCPSSMRKYPFQCQGCPKFYTRSDALVRHLRNKGCLQALTRSTSNPSSGPGGVPYTYFPVVPRANRALNLSESLSALIPPALVAAPPTPADFFARYGPIQPQILPTLYTNRDLYTNHSIPANYSSPPVLSVYDQHGLAKFQSFSSQHPPLNLSFVPNHAPSATHQGHYLRSQPIGPASQLSTTNALTLRYGYQPDPAVVAYQSNLGGWLSNHFALEPLSGGNQFLPDANVTYGALPTSSNQWRWAPHDYPARQPMAYSTQHRVTSTRSDCSQPETFTEDTPLFAKILQDHDLKCGQPAFGPPACIPLGGNFTNDQTTRSHFLSVPRPDTPGPSEFQAARVYDPSLELGRGSMLGALRSTPTATNPRAMLYSSSEALLPEPGPHLDHERGSTA